METIEKEFNAFRNQNTYWHAMQEGWMDAFDRKYETAVEKLRSETLGKEIPLVVGGEEITTGEWMERRSPNDQDILVCRFPKATKAHAKKAIEVAKSGFPSWSRVPWEERAGIIEKAADLFERDFYELCAIMTMESGKTRYEASIDVDEAIDFLRFYAFTMRKMNGFDMLMGKPVPNEQCRSIMKPYGVFSVICPFNFPVAITSGMTVGAIITGNAAVMKPATKGVLAGWKCFSLLKEAGVPDDVLQFVVGPDEEVAVELTSNPEITGLVFTGSKHIGFKIQEAWAKVDPGRPIIAEMGGKNAIIVTKNADLDKAVEGVYRSAFGFQGQKCSACSRILVAKEVKKEFLERLKARTEETVVDYPWKKEAFMGPIIEEAKYRFYQEWVEKGKDGGRLLTGGNAIGDEKNGWYVEPTVFADMPRDHPMFRTELFCPITAVWEVEDLDDALELANSVEYGLTTGIFTEDKEEAERFFDRIEAGVTYLNRTAGGSTAAVVNGQSFVGWKHSGSTGIGAGGRYYLLQFMRERSQTRVHESHEKDWVKGKGPRGP